MSATYDTITCECTPCRGCGGEGEHVIRYPRIHGEPDGELVIPCSACGGTGKDDGDCAVHGTPVKTDPEIRAFDPKWGITAAQLGIVEGPVCDACDAGDHEMPGKQCACPCHGQRRAA